MRFSNQMESGGDALCKARIAAVGERASHRFFELFTANNRNPRTRRAYARAARMANPASTPTTRLYERLAEEATLDKVERVPI
jgi:hypothetical protein